MIVSLPLRSTVRRCFGTDYDPRSLTRHFLFSEDNYTKTGFADVQRDTTNKAYGGCSTSNNLEPLTSADHTLTLPLLSSVHKLLFRTINGFPENSVYSWFPMSRPDKMEAVLTKGLAPGETGGWSFARPALPTQSLHELEGES